MNFLITGGTGFVGKKLATALHKKKHHTYILTRSPDKHQHTTNTTFIGYDFPIDELPPIYGVINLAGESLFGYWTKQKKENILASRVETTKKVIDMMKQLDRKPAVFINGSAIGFYGISEDLIFTENTLLPGNDFLAKVVLQWENIAKAAEQLDIRTVYARFGVILGKGGALPFMSLPVKMFAGGRIGNGEQWMSWVHIDDVIQLILFCIFNNKIAGPINVTAPNPKRNKDFTKTLAKNLKRPYWLPTPSPVIRLGIGEMSQLVLKGQYVLPSKALDFNYQFLYPNLTDALKDIHSERKEITDISQ